MKRENDLHVSPETASSFKKLGFNDPCLYYFLEKEGEISKNSIRTPDTAKDWNGFQSRVSGLLYDQAVNWLLDTYGVYVEARYDSDGIWTSVVSDINSGFSKLNHVTANIASRKEALCTGFTFALNILTEDIESENKVEEVMDGDN